MSLLLDALKKNAESTRNSENIDMTQAMNETLDVTEHARQAMKSSTAASRNVQPERRERSEAVSHNRRRAPDTPHEPKVPARGRSQSAADAAGTARPQTTATRTTTSHASSQVMAKRALAESQRRAKSVFTKQKELPALKPRVASGAILAVLGLCGVLGALVYFNFSNESDHLNTELSQLTARINNTLVLASETDLESQPIVQAVETQEAIVEVAPLRLDDTVEVVAASTNTAIEPVLSTDDLANDEASEVTEADLGFDLSGEDIESLSTANDLESFLAPALASLDSEALANPPGSPSAVKEVPASAKSQTPASERAVSAPSNDAVKVVEATRRSSGQLLITKSDTDVLLETAQQAYQAYQIGQFDEADRLYQQVLREEPGHRDALLGMAALALRADQRAAAAQYYRQLLTDNPRDHAALAGLSATQSLRAGSDMEAELRLRLRESPDSAPLHFSLGSVLSQQQRWAEAQAAFFSAFSANAKHPDYAYNLAVSLDQLGKAAAAVKFYREALHLSTRQPAGFDRAIVQQRIVALQP